MTPLRINWWNEQRLHEACQYDPPQSSRRTTTVAWASPIRRSKPDRRASTIPRTIDVAKVVNAYQPASRPRGLRESGDDT
jgi:hypothetical protein